MKLICGLGNPGREYEDHRHNVGFMVVDEVCRRLRASLDSTKFEGRFTQVSAFGDKVLLLEPQTFMNGSGHSLGAAARFYKVSPDDTLVVHDELDLPFGRLQLKQGGGSGGHNGLNSILESWGEDAFVRLRFGVGKPVGPNAKERVAGYVLSDFGPDEKKALPDLVERAANAVECWARLGLATAMNRYNRK